MAIAFGSSTTATGNNVTTSVITKPASTADGDMLLLFILVSESVGVTPTVTGSWTQKLRQDMVATGDNQDSTVILYWRRASSEPADYTITWDGTYGNYGAAHILRYTGVISSGDPFRTTSQTTSGASTTAGPVSAVGLTGVQSTDMAIHWEGACLSSWNGNDHNPAGPGGSWVERGEIVATAATSTPGVLAVEQLGTGSAPSFSATGTGTALVWNLLGGALMEQPAASAKGANIISAAAVQRASTR